ncbi:MAG: crossover junction endodeoxyribonuclease RuvC [Chloroflexota bacterium]|nr:MAG: crossover junction endodeoxyribonuclease RuvC [Chloroflexota bacterium]
MKVLGIDPGLVITGYGVLEQEGGRTHLLEAGVLDSGTSADELPVRLRRLHDEMHALIRDHQPDVMALEQLYSHYQHPRTAILMGHARGVICLVAGLHNLPLFHYAATEVKSSVTGNGRASKEQIQHMVRSTFGLVETPEPPDAADAVAIGLCHIHRQGQTSYEDRVRALR